MRRKFQYTWTAPIHKCSSHDEWALCIYMLHGQALEAMDHAKYLGVDISKDLSWNTIINRIYTNANRTLGFLKRNIKTKTQKSAQLHTKPWPALKLNTYHSMEPLNSKLR